MEELNLKQFENIGVIADLSNWSPSDEEEKENKEIADFIENNPFPDNDTFLDFQFKTAMALAKKCSVPVPLGGSYDDRIVKKIYENILDEDIVKECGRELYKKDGMKDLLRCHLLLDEIIKCNYNQGNNNDKYDRMIILPLPRLVEHYWDGIGEWCA